MILVIETKPVRHTIKFVKFIIMKAFPVNITNIN